MTQNKGLPLLRREPLDGSPNQLTFLAAFGSAQGLRLHRQRRLNVLEGRGPVEIAPAMTTMILPDEPGDTVDPRRERPCRIVPLSPAIQRDQGLLDEILRPARMAAQAMEVGEQWAFPASKEQLQGALLARLDPRHHLPVVSHVRSKTPASPQPGSSTYIRSITAKGLSLFTAPPSRPWGAAAWRWPGRLAISRQGPTLILCSAHRFGWPTLVGARRTLQPPGIRAVFLILAATWSNHDAWLNEPMNAGERQMRGPEYGPGSERQRPAVMSTEGIMMAWPCQLFAREERNDW